MLITQKETKEKNMKLKIGRIVCKTLVVLITLALFGGALTTGELQKMIWLGMLALIVLLAVCSLVLLRCPYCGGQVHLYGMTYCPKCGEQIGKDHEGDRGNYILGPIARGDTAVPEEEEAADDSETIENSAGVPADKD